MKASGAESSKTTAVNEDYEDCEDDDDCDDDDDNDDDDDDSISRLMRKAMHEPLFVEFVDECLRIRIQQNNSC